MEITSHAHDRLLSLGFVRFGLHFQDRLLINNKIYIFFFLNFITCFLTTTYIFHYTKQEGFEGERVFHFNFSQFWEPFQVPNIIISSVFLLLINLNFKISNTHILHFLIQISNFQSQKAHSHKVCFIDSNNNKNQVSYYEIFKTYLQLIPNPKLPTCIAIYTFPSSEIPFTHTTLQKMHTF